MVPEQVIRPAARLAQRIHVGAPEEIGLHVHLQHFQLTCRDPAADPLVAGIEAARVTSHGHQARLLLHLHQLFGVGQVVRHRDFDHHVLAGLQALYGLRGVHLGRRRQQHGVQAWLLQALCQVARVMRDAEFLCHFPGGLLVAAGQRDDLDAGDVADRLEMLDAKGALTCQTYFHGMNLNG